MMTVVVSQISWFVGVVSRQTTIWLLTIGLAFLYIGAALKISRQYPVLVDKLWWQRVAIVGSFGVGFLFSSLSLLQSYYGVYAVFLFALFRMLEGAAVVRLYQKVYSLLRGELPEGRGNFKSKMARRVAKLFIFLLGVWTSLYVLVTFPIIPIIIVPLAAIWTIASFLITYLGATLRLEPVKKKLNIPLFVGFGLCIASAEIFNFRSLQGEIAQYLVGSGAYSVGFWLAVSIWFWNQLYADEPIEAEDGFQKVSSLAQYIPGFVLVYLRTMKPRSSRRILEKISEQSEQEVPYHQPERHRREE